MTFFDEPDSQCFRLAKMCSCDPPLGCPAVCHPQSIPPLPRLPAPRPHPVDGGLLFGPLLRSVTYPQSRRPSRPPPPAVLRTLAAGTSPGGLGARRGHRHFAYTGRCCRRLGASPCPPPNRIRVTRTLRRCLGRRPNWVIGTPARLAVKRIRRRQPYFAVALRQA